MQCDCVLYQGSELDWAGVTATSGKHENIEQESQHRPLSPAPPSSLPTDLCTSSLLQWNITISVLSFYVKTYWNFMPFSFNPSYSILFIWQRRGRHKCEDFLLSSLSVPLPQLSVQCAALTESNQTLFTPRYSGKHPNLVNIFFAVTGSMIGNNCLFDVIKDFMI